MILISKLGAGHDLSLSLSEKIGESQEHAKVSLAIV
jgi:hypothetical protein